jgi:hypothetical protein
MNKDKISLNLDHSASNGSKVNKMDEINKMDHKERVDHTWVGDCPVKSRKKFLLYKFYVGGDLAIKIQEKSKRKESADDLVSRIISPKTFVEYKLTIYKVGSKYAEYKKDIMYSEELSIEEVKLIGLIKAKELGWSVEKILLN